MDKLNYRKELVTENGEHVDVGTYDNDSDIIIGLIDDEQDCAIVTLTLKEAKLLKTYLKEAITINIMNWEEE